MDVMPDPRRRRLVLAVCCLSLFVVAVDNTIVNVALPAIQRDLSAPLSGLQWIVAAYTLVLASLLILAGSTADRIGRRRVFQTGLVVFSVGSLLCSLSPNLTWLIVFRIVQAIGGSMLNPVAMSIIINTFTDARERARAIGVWGAVVGISLACGPLLGGVLVHTIGWRSIFWVNVPFGVAAVVLTAVFVPESRAPRPRRLDPVGQLLLLVTLGTLTYGIIEGPTWGWASVLIVSCFMIAAVGLVALVRYESRRPEALLDPRYFRSIPFTGATVCAVFAFAGLAGVLFVNTLYLQDERGFTPLAAGLCTLPLAVMSVVFSPLSGRLLAARGPRPSLVAAGSSMSLGALLLVRLEPATPLWWLLLAYAIFGFGFAMVNSPITYTAISGMPTAQAGVAAAVASTSRQFGQVLGVAVIGTAVAGGMTAAGAVTFAQASRTGWWIIAGCGLAVLVLGFVTTTPWARSTIGPVQPALLSAPPPGRAA
jgi:EmrB/QacA subfamily drug resistance transporter